MALAPLPRSAHELSPAANLRLYSRTVYVFSPASCAVFLYPYPCSKSFRHSCRFSFGAQRALGIPAVSRLESCASGGTWLLYPYPPPRRKRLSLILDDQEQRIRFQLFTETSLLHRNLTQLQHLYKQLMLHPLRHCHLLQIHTH